MSCPVTNLIGFMITGSEMLRSLRVGFDNPHLGIDPNGMLSKFSFEPGHIVNNDVPAVRPGVPLQPSTDFHALAEAFDLAGVLRV